MQNNIAKVMFKAGADVAPATKFAKTINAASLEELITAGLPPDAAKKIALHCAKISPICSSKQLQSILVTEPTDVITSVWDKFLPPTYLTESEICDYIASFSSKEEALFRLCDLFLQRLRNECAIHQGHATTPQLTTIVAIYNLHNTFPGKLLRSKFTSDDLIKTINWVDNITTSEELPEFDENNKWLIATMALFCGPNAIGQMPDDHDVAMAAIWNDAGCLTKINAPTSEMAAVAIELSMGKTKEINNVATRIINDSHPPDRM